MVIMVLAQIGLAQHNSVHVIDHHHNASHDISQEHHGDDNQKNPNQDCQTYHFASSLHGLNGNNQFNIGFDQYISTNFYNDVFYAKNLNSNYRSRAPPIFLI